LFNSSCSFQNAGEERGESSLSKTYSNTANAINENDSSSFEVKFKKRERISQISGHGKVHNASEKPKNCDEIMKYRNDFLREADSDE
jgi:hypothetical protein